MGCGRRCRRPARDLVLRARRLARARPALGRADLRQLRALRARRGVAVPRLPLRVSAGRPAAHAPGDLPELELRDVVRGAHGRLRSRLHRAGGLGAARGRRRDGAHLGGVAHDRGRAARPRLAVRHTLRPVADAARGRRARGPRPGATDPERSAPRARLRREALAGGSPADRGRLSLAAERAAGRPHPRRGVRRRRDRVLPALRDPRAARPAHDVRRPARPAAPGGEPRRRRADGGAALRPASAHDHLDPRRAGAERTRSRARCRSLDASSRSWPS